MSTILIERNLVIERMSKIRQKDTKIEIKFRKTLHAMGFRYRLHNRKLAGSPDIVLARYNIAIFIHGCFWHFHRNCKYSKVPATNTEFWKAKLENNRARDLRQQLALTEKGWRVLIIWGCAISSDFDNTVKRAASWIIHTNAHENFKEIRGSVSSNAIR